MRRLAVPPSYYHIKDKDLILCTTPRVASSSMCKILTNKPVVSQQRALSLRKEGVDVMMWIRDPMDRLACAFNLQMNQRLTFPQFVHRVLTETNRHWIPQTDLHSYNEEFVPGTIYLYEDLNETWPLGTLGHERKSRNRRGWASLMLELNPNQLDIILSHYIRDSKLYDKVRELQ